MLNIKITHKIRKLILRPDCLQGTFIVITLLVYLATGGISVKIFVENIAFVGPCCKA